MDRNIKLNLLDRTIGYISPSWGYARAAWRNSFVRNFYDSGSNGRITSGWNAINAPAEQTNQMSRDKIRARARDLERNSDIGESIIGAFVRNVIGTGIILQSKILNSNGDEADTLNEQIEEAFEDWCRAKNCDIAGELSFHQMQAMAMRRMIVDGGILFIKSIIDGKFVLQVREVDDIDTSYYLVGSGKKIINGIELNEYNGPVKYHLKKTSPDGLFSGERQEISADRVIFLHDKIRPSQIREISRLARTAGRVKDVNEFVEAVSIKERILACLSIFIKKMLPGGGIGKFNNTIDTETELPEQIIAPGMINHLQPGDDVQIVNPAGQASNAKEFIAIQQRLAASGQGLSYEVASRDMSKSNYSSARQGLLEDQKTYKPEQKYIIETFCMEVYTSWLIWAVLAGEINIPDFWQNKKKYMRHKWYPPGWSWIDPLKEVKANQIALGSGQTTHAEICAGNGLDWKDVFRQLAKEQKLAKKIGLKLGEYNNANESEENESKESEESTSGGDNSN